MPVYLVWLLIVLAVSGVAGLGFTLGSGLGLGLAFVGASFIVFILWDPLIKPAIARVMKK
jgi:hypothetical protein